MPKYSIKVKGKTVKFSAENQREAISKAFSISTYYCDLKRLDSRWWLLIYPVGFLLGWFFMNVLMGV
ncbi:MAG TPA: hypothetical protein VIC51_12360 [Psychromonas sp.]